MLRAHQINEAKEELVGVEFCGRPILELSHDELFVVVAWCQREELQRRKEMGRRMASTTGGTI